MWYLNDPNQRLTTGASDCRVWSGPGWHHCFEENELITLAEVSIKVYLPYKYWTMHYCWVSLKNNICSLTTRLFVYTNMFWTCLCPIHWLIQVRDDLLSIKRSSLRSAKVVISSVSPTVILSMSLIHVGAQFELPCDTGHLVHMSNFSFEDTSVIVMSWILHLFNAAVIKV